MIPKRMCVACRQMKDKCELIRVSKCCQGNITIDDTKKAEGRGAYVCKNKECIEKCIKNKSLNKNFKCSVNENIYNMLKENDGQN